MNLTRVVVTVKESEMFSDFKAKFAGMHKSCTIWFNTAAAALLPLLDYAQANLPVIQDYLPNHYYGWLMLLTVVGNILLRFKTIDSLADKNA